MSEEAILPKKVDPNKGLVQKERMNLKDLEQICRGDINLSAAQKLLSLSQQRLKDPRYDRYRLAFEEIRNLAKSIKRRQGFEKDYSIKNEVVRIGSPDVFKEDEAKALHKALEKMIPWRKGPFDLCGIEIDSEWRSDKKWQRLKKHTGPLQGRVVLDIGCNNGYYMYLMAKQNPRFVLGIDPTVPYHYQYKAMETFVAPKNTMNTLLGVDDMQHFKKVFDVIFCLGIVYHHQNPIGMFQTLFESLRPGGLMIVETMAVNQDGPFWLMPDKRYMGMPGHWYIPTREALEVILTRTGFRYIEVISEQEMDLEEQRKTAWAPHASFTDGLDPKDPSKTVEGYPVPGRLLIKARRAKKRA